jgi:hypothetical protein
MAVDKSKVIARLKVLFPKANLSQKRLDALADKLAKKPADDADDTAIDAVINDFNEIYSYEDIAKDDDRLRTLESEKNKPKPTDPPKPDPNNPNPNPEPPKPDDTPAWAKAMVDKLEKVTTELETIKSGEVVKTKLQTAQSLIEKSEVLKNLKPEIKNSWLKRIDLNSETPFEEQVTALETEYTDLVQVSVNSTAHAGAAGGGGVPSTVNEKDIEKLVNEM